MEITPGQTVTQERVLAQEEFNRFASLSGDDNPIHVDPEFSARTRFGKTVAHGMFLYSLIDSTLKRNFPGAVQVSQDLMFPEPSYVGEKITVSLRVVEVQPAVGRARLETVITRPGGQIGCQGETIIQWNEI